MELTYVVGGMTCDQCTAAVEEEVADLKTKRVVVTGEAVDDAAVRAAIDEAGYAAA